MKILVINGPNLNFLGIRDRKTYGNESYDNLVKMIMKWADEIRTLMIRTNADTPRDAQQAIDFGAEGIGLCRTEHMFFDEERIPAIREMIIADSEEARRKALAKLLPFQKSDFKAMFKVLGGRPMTVRLLDPPPAVSP